jgi:hypothetical protein
MSYNPGVPSKMWDEVIGSKLDDYGDPYFEFLGNCRISVSKGKLPQQSVVNPLFREIVDTLIPEYCNTDGSLKVKYSRTSVYPYAEYNSISEFAFTPKPISESGWQQAKIMLYDAFRCMEDSTITLFDSSVQMCDRQSSPGYPWQLLCPNKGDLFDCGIFRPYYLKFEADLLNDELPPTISRCFIKKEFKKITDILEHRPRSILAAPTELSVLGNRLFGDMNGKMAVAGAAGEVPAYVGVTRYHGGWDSLAVRLARFPNKFDGDCTRFDKSVDEKSHNTMAEVRTKWLRVEKFHKAIQAFYTYINFTLIIGALGDLFKKKSGQPSGQTNTLADNSLIHCMYWFYYWCTSVVPFVAGCMPTWSSFRQHVELIVMGDDVVYSCDDLVLPFMVPSKVAKAFTGFGVKLKYSSDTPVEFDKLEFCSTNFSLIRGKYMPVLRREKLLASTFYHESKNPRMLLRRMLALRIEGWYDLWYRDVINKSISMFVAQHLSALKAVPSGKDGDDQSYDQIMSLWWSSARIEHAYRDPYDG